MADNNQNAQTKANIQKVINEYNEMKSLLIQTKTLLKNEVQEKNDYIEKHQALMIQNRSFEEENNTLKVNYEVIQKRYDQLQKDLGEAKKTTKNYSMLSYFTGSSSIKEENSEMKTKILMLENELELKIKENEDCHVEVFDYKKQVNDKQAEIDEQMTKFTQIVEEKSNEVMQLIEMNKMNADLKTSIEKQLEQLQLTHEDLKKNYNQQTVEYKNTKVNLNKEISDVIMKAKEYYSINEFSNEEFLLYNIDFLNSNKQMKTLWRNQLNLLKTIINLLIDLFSDKLEKLISLIKEKVSVLISDNHTITNPTLLLLYEKIESHFFTLQEYTRTLSLILRMIIKELIPYEDIASNINSININQLILYRNIALVLLKQIIITCDSIGKFYIQVINQLNLSNDNTKQSIIEENVNSFMTSSKSFLQKLFLFFNYDEEYNDREITIITDNSYNLTITISKTYIENYKVKSFCHAMNRTFIIDLFSVEITKLREIFESLIKSITIYNLIQLSSQENDNQNKMIQMTQNDITNIFTSLYQSEDNILKSFMVKTALNKSIPFIIISNVYLRKIQNDYNILSYEFEEITYKEAIKYKEELLMLKQSESVHNEEKMKNERMIKEYEEKINKLSNLLLNEQNVNDLLKTQLNSNQSITSEDNINITMTTPSVSDSSVEFEEFLKNRRSLMTNDYIIKNEEVLKGNLKSSINNDSVQRFNEIIEKDGIGSLYHRKVIEKLKRYATQVKNIDVKVVANIQETEIRSEYEKKLKEMASEHEAKVSELNETISQKQDAFEGFLQQINYLSESISDYEELKELLCKDCKKHIKEKND